MLVVFGVLVGGTYILDRLCRFAQYKEMVGWFWTIKNIDKKNKKGKEREKKYVYMYMYVIYCIVLMLLSNLI